jgi:uncharacterized Zn finger protein (UPF0148 family)
MDDTRANQYMNPPTLETPMTMATPPPPPPITPSYHPIEPVTEKPSKQEPWGDEDPLLWSAQRARFHAIWGSSAIALFVLLFGVGMYTLFTVAIYEGSIEGHGSLIVLLLAPFILAIVGAVATGALARNVGRMAKQPLAPAGAGMARGILWFSVFLWILLLLMFPLSLTVTTEPGEGGDDPFPIGIITVLPVYIGFCVAIYTTGAAYSAWSDNNKVECMLIIGLAWAAFAMFLLLPAVVSSWNLGAEDPDVDWDSAVWWLRFGNLFPAITPWLIVVGLYYVHNRSISILVDSVRGEDGPPPFGVPDGTTSADSCPSCGGKMSEHPSTLEIFCAACGWGLKPEVVEPLMVDASPAPTHEDQGFVERVPPSAPDTASATVTTSATPAHACSICGGELAVLSKTQQIYCTGCGAGLPGKEGRPPPSGPPPQQPAERAPPQVQPSAPAPTPTPVQAQPGPPEVLAQTKPGSRNCPLCGAPVAIHPTTGETFCPACGAGLRPEQ